MARLGRFAAVSGKAARIKISLLLTTLLSSAPAFVYAASAEIPIAQRITDNYIILAQNNNGGYLQDSPYRVRRVGEATPQRHPSEPLPTAAELHQKALEMRALQERAIKTEPVRAPIVDTAVDTAPPPPPKPKVVAKPAPRKAAPRPAPVRKAVVRKAAIIRPQPEINTDAAARALEADLLRELQATADKAPEAPKMLQKTEQPAEVSAPAPAMTAPKNVLRMPVEKLAPAMEPEVAPTPKTVLVIEPAAAPSREEVPAPKNVLQMPAQQSAESGIPAPRMIERKLSEVPAENDTPAMPEKIEAESPQLRAVEVLPAPQMPPVIRDTRPAMSSEERARNMLFGDDEPEAEEEIAAPQHLRESLQEPVQEAPKVMRLPAPKMATTRPLPQKHQGPSVIIPQVSPRAALVNPEDVGNILQPVPTRQTTAKAIEAKLKEALKDKIIEEKAPEKTVAKPVAKPVAKEEKKIIAKPVKAALKPKETLPPQPVAQPAIIQAPPVVQKLPAPEATKPVAPQQMLKMPEMPAAKPLSQPEPTKIPLPQPQSEPVAVEPRAAAVPSVSPAKPAADTPPLNVAPTPPTLSDELPPEMNQKKIPAGQGAAAEPAPSPAAQKITNALNALRQKIRGNAAPQQISAPDNADEAPVTPEVVIDGDDAKVKLKPLSGVFDANGNEVPAPVLELAYKLKEQAAARETERMEEREVQVYAAAQHEQEESLLQELQQVVTSEKTSEKDASIPDKNSQVVESETMSDADAGFLQNAGGGVMEEAFAEPVIAPAALVTEESMSPSQEDGYKAAQPVAGEPAVKAIPISMKAGDKPFSSWSKQTQEDLAQLSVVADDVGLAPIKLSKVTSVIGGGTEVSDEQAPEPEMVTAQLPVSVPVYPDAATQKVTSTEVAVNESGDKTVQTLFITPAPVQEPIRQTIPGSEEDVSIAAPIVPELPVQMAENAAPEEVYQPKLSNESKALLQRLPSGVGSPLPEPAGEPFEVKHINSSSLEAEDEIEGRKAKGMKMQIARPNVDVARYLEEAYQAQLKEDLGTAMDRYQAVADAQPNNVEAKFGLATTYHRMGELVMARNLYAEIIQIQPNYVEALNNLLVLISQESPDEAMDELKKLERKNPQFSPIPAQMAAIYARNEDFGSAIESIQRAIILDPDNLAYRYNAAVLMDRAGRSEEAIELYVLLKRSHERGQVVPADMAGIQERLTFLLSNRG